MKRTIGYPAVVAAIFILSSCASPQGKEQEALGLSERYAKESKVFFHKAVEALEEALTRAGDVQAIEGRLGEIYYQNAQYDKAVEHLQRASDPKAQRLLAMAYYQAGDFTDALSQFNRLGEIDDDGYLYYYGLSCESHHLYDQALKLYARIDRQDIKKMAQERAALINSEKTSSPDQALDPLIQKYLKNPLKESDYPQAGAVIVFSREEYIVHDDNTTEFIDHHLIKILNERGKKYAEVKTFYDSTYEKVDIITARTINPDGTVAAAGAKHTRDVSRYLNFPLYSNARAKIVSMPEVAIGSMIEVKVKTTSNRMIAERHMNLGYLLQSFDPILEADFTLRLPEDRALNQRLLNESYNVIKADLHPTVKTEKGKRIYQWHFENIPQIIPEPSMPPAAEITPVIWLSTFSGWEDIFRWWLPLAKDKIEVSPDMKAKIKELTANAATLLDKIKAIYHFCAKDIRYVAVEYGDAGFEPHRAAEIFSNKYGDCKDQAILLVSMLREIGVEAYPVLIGTRGTMALVDDFPAMVFNHCIAVIRHEGELIFLDPTGETVSYGDLPEGDQGRRVMVFFDDGWQLVGVPRFSADHNTLASETVFTVHDDEAIDARTTAKTQGLFNQAQRGHFWYTMPILIEEEIKEKIQSSLPGSRLIDYKAEGVDDMNKDIVLSYRYKGTDYFIKAGERARIVPLLSLADLSLVTKERRLYPIDFSSLANRRRTVRIDLPPRYKIKYLPESISKDTPWFTFKGTFSFADGAFVFDEERIQKTIRIETKDYQAYKEALEALSKEIRQSAIFELDD